MTIKFGQWNIKEYFNITNVEYYDAILGTPFLRKMGVILDFTGPGEIKMGNEIIPNDKAIFDDSIKERSARMGKAPSRVRPVQNRPDGAWVDLTKAHLLKLPIIMGTGMLQKWKWEKERQAPHDIIGGMSI